MRLQKPVLNMTEECDDYFYRTVTSLDTHEGAVTHT